jgi:hypothetical protein
MGSMLLKGMRRLHNLVGRASLCPAFLWQAPSPKPCSEAFPCPVSLCPAPYALPCRMGMRLLQLLFCSRGIPMPGIPMPDIPAPGVRLAGPAAWGCGCYNFYSVVRHSYARHPYARPRCMRFVPNLVRACSSATREQQPGPNQSLECGAKTEQGFGDAQKEARDPIEAGRETAF